MRHDAVKLATLSCGIADEQDLGDCALLRADRVRSKKVIAYNYAVFILSLAYVQYGRLEFVRVRSF